jgi:hypothetical protein
MELCAYSQLKSIGNARYVKIPPEILRYLQADLSLVANTRNLSDFIKVLTANALCEIYTEILLIQRMKGMQVT